MDPHLTYLQMYLMCVPIVELIFSDLVFFNYYCTVSVLLVGQGGGQK